MSKTLEIKRRLFRQTQELVWYNIHKIGEAFGSSTSITAKYGNEIDALKVIDGHKNRYQLEKENEELREKLKGFGHEQDRIS